MSTVKNNTAERMPLSFYDRFIVEYSGGKDSLACLLYIIELMLEENIPLDRLEIWHHLIDGAPGTPSGLMDWPCSEDYVKATAEALGIKLRFQWKEGGFLGELYRENALTAPTSFELMDGSVLTRGGKRGKPQTQRRWPQKSSNLRVRYCSSTLKIDVGAIAIRNDPAFKDKRILEVTGERREESANRARYAEFERHKAHTKRRHVTIWRPVIDWSEEGVWAIIRRWHIHPHPAYVLGFGRVSCMKCIFADYAQWASIRELDPKGFNRIAAIEQEFNYTIDRKLTVIQMADKGTSFVTHADPEMIKLAMTPGAFTKEMFFLPKESPWIYPAGAFKRCGGPS